MLMPLHNNSGIDTAKKASSAASKVVVSKMDRAVPRQRFTRARLVAGVIMTLVIILVAAAYLRYGRSGTLIVSKERLTLATVTQGVFQEYIPLVGTLTPIDTVYLDVIESGQVAEVLVEEGSMVTAGQLLLRLKSTRPEMELMTNEASLAEQVNQLSATKLQYEQTRLTAERSVIDTRAILEKLLVNHTRMFALRNSGVISRAEIENEELDIAHYRQLLEAAEKSLALSENQGSLQVKKMQRTIDSLTAKLDIARQNLDSLNVRAPISGQLTTLNVHVGEAKNSSQRIGQIDRLEQTKVTASVDEFYLNRVVVGQQSSAEIDGRVYQFKVRKVYPEVRDRLFNIDLQFVAAAPASARVGQSLQLRLDIGGTSHALIVDNGPFYDGASAGVFVVSPSTNSAERRVVKLGRRNTDSVEILAGLSAGEQIVASSYESFNGITRLQLR